MYNIYKYRAWSFEHNLMIYSHYKTILNKAEIQWCIDEKGIYIEVLNPIDNRIYVSGLMINDNFYIPEQDVMMFTGKKDIINKSIYQGDIIKCVEPDFMGHVGGTGYSIGQRFHNAVVDYYDGAFYYYPNGNMKQPHALLNNAVEIEVIGNIYETPTLIL